MLAKVSQKSGSALSPVDISRMLAAHERFAMSRGGERARFVRHRLDRLSFANRILSEADFAGASLVGANFRGSNLQRASFYCADLRECDLQGANLARADMRGATFCGANAANAIFDGADLRAARMMIVEDDGVTTSGQAGSDARLHGVDFTNCSLKNVSFANARFDNADFSGAILEGAKFKGAKFENILLKGAVLTGVELKDLQVPQDALEGCIFDVSLHALEKSDSLKTLLAGHEQWVAHDGQRSLPAVLDKEDLRPLHDFFVGRRLIALSARSAIGIGLNFSGCRLQAARLDGADLRDADFTDCDLRGVSFRGAKLTHAKFTGARLGTLTLANGNALATNFEGAHAAQAQFHDANVNCAPGELGIR